MSVDHGDARQEVEIIQRRLKALETGTPQRHSGDSEHPGATDDSIQLGRDAAAIGDPGSIAIGATSKASDLYSIAFGYNAWATGSCSLAVGLGSLATNQFSSAFGENAKAQGDYSTCLGTNALAAYNDSTAVGSGSTTTATNQIMLGNSGQTVVVPGTFSNPSARRLKRNITPAPAIRDLFPALVEYEKIDAPGPRHLGYIADDLEGTGAERFVVLDDDGAPAGINYLGLLIAQVAQLNERIATLEKEAGNG
jgi:hypothetical protein